jgi:hypothetical protein
MTKKTAADENLLIKMSQELEGVEQITSAALHSGFNTCLGIDIEQEKNSVTITICKFTHEALSEQVEELNKIEYNPAKFVEKFEAALKAAGIKEPRSNFKRSNPLDDLITFYISPDEFKSLDINKLTSHLEEVSIPELKKELGNIPAQFINHLLTKKISTISIGGNSISTYGLKNNDLEEALLDIAATNKINLNELAKKQDQGLNMVDKYAKRTGSSRRNVE